MDAAINGEVTQVQAMAEMTTLGYGSEPSSNSENEDMERRKDNTTRLNAKIRRLRANDRERRRIQSINGAMEALRKVIPDTKHNTKITKLQLLRLAQDYIKTLSEILRSSNANSVAQEMRFDVFSAYSPRNEVAFYSDNYQEPCFSYGFQ